MKFKFKKIVTFISILGMLSGNFSSISYADTISIKYNNQKINYSDTQVQYTINGEAIKSKYPGIIVDGISLASAKEIFSDSKIGLSYKFNKKKNTLELKRDGKTLVLTLNSYQAKVDGKNETVPIEPRLVEFSDKVSKLYVPARYVAKTFGLTYNWDEASGIASMTGKTVKKKAKKKDSKKKDTKADKKTTKNNKKESFTYNGKTYAVKGKKIVFSINKVKVNDTKLPGVYVGKNLMAPAKNIFLSNGSEGTYSYSKSKKTVVLGLDDNVMTMTLGSKEADFNGTMVTLRQAPNKITLNFSDKSEVYVPIEDICELFEIGIEINKSVSTLSLPDNDNVEDITAEGDENTENDNKKNTDNSKKDASNDTKPDKPLAPFMATTLPFNWKAINAETVAKSFNTVQTVSGNNHTGISSIIDIVNASADSTVPYDTYTITSTAGFNGVTGNLVGNQLNIKLEKVTSNQGQSYTSNIRTVNYINTSYNAGANSTEINFGLVQGVIGYDISLSNDNKNLTVKIYKNTITEISGSYSNGTYTFTLTGLAPLTVQENGNSGNNIDLTVPNIIDTIGSGSYTDNAGNKINLFTYFNNGVEGGRISITKSASLKYYTKQVGNSISLVLSEASSQVEGAVVKLPAGITSNDIAHEDNYFSNNFTITLPGDLKSYYASNPIQYDSEKVSNVTVGLDEDGDTVLTFYTTALYAYRLNFANNKINIAIDRAKKLYSKVVVIDPGHGGHDSGTLSNNGIYQEKNVVLSIGYTYLRNYLEDEDLKVYWTRKDDTFMTLKNRAAFAKKVDADLFISVHMNSAGKNTSAKGTEVYYSTRNNTLQDNGLSSYIMASIFLKNITSNLKMSNRGVKSNVFVVTNVNTVPAVLIEYGFLSNADDLDKFSKLENQDKSAEILYNTIEEIFDNYPTGR